MSPTAPEGEDHPTPTDPEDARRIVDRLEDAHVDVEAVRARDERESRSGPESRSESGSGSGSESRSESNAEDTAPPVPGTPEPPD